MFLGGLARTAANNDAGARTPMAGMMTGMMMIVVLFSLTTSFYYIPKACLGVYIILSVKGLIDFTIFKEAYKLSKKDFLVMTVTFTVTIILGVSSGLMCGIICSMLAMIHTSAFPSITSLGVYIPHARVDDDINNEDNLSIWRTTNELSAVLLPAPILAPLLPMAAAGVNSMSAISQEAEESALDMMFVDADLDDLNTIQPNIQIQSLSSANSLQRAVSFQSFTPTLIQKRMFELVKFIDHGVFRDMGVNAKTRAIPGIFIARMDAPLVFTNAPIFRQYVLDHVLPCAVDGFTDTEPEDNSDASVSREVRSASAANSSASVAPPAKIPVKLFILDTSGWNEIDFVGIQ